MQIIIFALGVMIGLYIRDIKTQTLEAIEKYDKQQNNKGTAEFFEPKTKKEKWKEAKSIDNLLEDINN